MSRRLNWLRAGVLGTNDGIVSTAGLVVGVAGATSSRGAIFTAGLAGLVAGAVSMALGEYISVSSSRDSEKAQLAHEKWELENLPEQEFRELVEIYRHKGLTEQTAQLVASELTAAGPLAAHADVELHIDPDALSSPVQASVASAISFLSGACLPLLAIMLASQDLRVWYTIAVVLVALALTGVLSARLGGRPPRAAVVRVVTGGAAGLSLTYLVGDLFGTAVG
jgi:vacuolar iron transporter family protein